MTFFLLPKSIHGGGPGKGGGWRSDLKWRARSCPEIHGDLACRLTAVAGLRGLACTFELRPRGSPRGLGLPCRGRPPAVRPSFPSIVYECAFPARRYWQVRKGFLGVLKRMPGHVGKEAWGVRSQPSPKFNMGAVIGATGESWIYIYIYILFTYMYIYNMYIYIYIICISTHI